MGWRNIYISKSARLSLAQNCLVIRQKDEVSVPLEDIAAIIIESQEVLITSALLNKLAEEAICLFVCDGSHLPSGIMTPYQQHSRFYKVLKLQLEQTLPFKKNCWRLIARQKIANQALCLELLDKKGADELRKLAADVRSGDPANREGTAARIYFDSYMPTFSRQEDNTVNAALNYGYSIMRGAVARSLTAFGFLGALGVHHKNELNSFNLADDFMEVLRPVVDLWVARNIKEGDSFSIKHRTEIVSLLNADVLIEFARQTLTRGIDIMCTSYSAAISANEPEKLKLPALLEIKPHVWN